MMAVERGRGDKCLWSRFILLLDAVNLLIIINNNNNNYNNNENSTEFSRRLDHSLSNAGKEDLVTIEYE